MSDYTKLTNFAVKDGYTTGNPAKVIKGTEIDDEFNAIATAVATKVDSTDVIPVATGGTGSTTATAARSALGAAKSGANSDITSLSGLTTALSVPQGGTGAATLTANAVLLGNGTSAPQTVAPGASGNVLVSNGTTWVSSAPIRQIVSAENATTINIASSVIPFDNTIPQNTEGTEVVTVTITPKSATSKLLIQFSGGWTNLEDGRNVTYALFKNSDAGAIYATGTFSGGTSFVAVPPLAYVMTSGTTSAITFKVRVGLSSAQPGGWYGNLHSGSSYYGGVMKQVLSVTEIG